MRIKITAQICGSLGSFVAGAIEDVPDDVAAEWCAAGVAERLEEPLIETATTAAPVERAVGRPARNG